jgi:putative transposase
VSERVARSRELVAQGRPAALVARVAGISRQAIYRRPRRPPRGQRRPLNAIDQVVLAVAREDEHATDGTRMIAAIASRRAGQPVNRKRCQRLMREHALLQPQRSEGRRRRRGHFRSRVRTSSGIST